MKRIARILLVALAALGLCSCSNSFKDIKVTSFDIVSLTPRGLSSIDAVVAIGVDNPTVQVSLTQMSAALKMDGIPCIYATAEDATLAARSNQVYTLTLHGTLDDEFNPFQILTLLKNPDLKGVTADVHFRGTLSSGLGKTFDYKDIDLSGLINKK